MYLKSKEIYTERLVLTFRCTKDTAEKYRSCAKKVNISAMLRQVIDEFCAKGKLDEMDL